MSKSEFFFGGNIFFFHLPPGTQQFPQLKPPAACQSLGKSNVENSLADLRELECLDRERYAQIDS